MYHDVGVLQGYNRTDSVCLGGFEHCGGGDKILHSVANTLEYRNVVVMSAPCRAAIKHVANTCDAYG